MIAQKTLLRTLTVVFLTIYATPVKANSDWCYARSAPKINILPMTEDISFNFTKSERELNEFKIDTINPYGENVIVDVGGLMAGGIELSHNTSLGYITHPSYGQTCMWFDTINIKLDIKPTIYIAREYNKGTCMHNSIMEHEMKHIEVDREIVNKYADKIGYEVNRVLTENYLFGPVLETEAPELQAQMIESVNGVIRNFGKALQEERRIEQQKVDTKEEYERVANNCKQFMKYRKRKKR